LIPPGIEAAFVEGIGAIGLVELFVDLSQLGGRDMVVGANTQGLGQVALRSDEVPLFLLQPREFDVRFGSVRLFPLPASQQIAGIRTSSLFAVE
jgi:hypothetical protein